MHMHANTESLLCLIKQSSEKKKVKKKTKQYTPKQFEKKVGTKPMTVTFIKRTNGQERVMNLLRDWDTLNDNAEDYSFKPGHGAGLIDYDKKNLSLVWDLDKKNYRMVNLDAVKSIKPFIQ